MNEIETLKREIEELKRWKASLEASHSVPLNIDQSFRQRFGLSTSGSILNVSKGGTGASTLTGILKGNGTGAFTAITPVSGAKEYYVATISGGSPDTKLTFTNGVFTKEN